MMHRSSYCGVNCEKCCVYIATEAADNDLKIKVAEDWGKLYKQDFAIADINCRGCKSSEIFGLCSQCDIKPCNELHGVSNCEDCSQFICDRMRRFFEYHKTNDTGSVFD